jgi:hypothetical protein
MINRNVRAWFVANITCLCGHGKHLTTHWGSAGEESERTSPMLDRHSAQAFYDALASWTPSASIRFLTMMLIG